MSNERRTRQSRKALGMLVSLAIVLTLFFGLHASQPALAYGMLGGGCLALVLGLVLMLRGERAGTLGRTANGEADERDSVVLQRTFALLGKLALPLGGAVVVAVALGVEPMIALAA